MTKCLTRVASYILMTVLVPSAYAAGSVNLSDQSDEEYAVYAAVVDKLFAGNKVSFDTGVPVNLLVIKNHTAADRFGDRLLADNLSGDMKDYVEHWLSDVSKGAVEEYRAKNKAPYKLNDTFKLKIKHVLAEQEELERFWKEKKWKEFYEKYPESGGFISFSRVGFNSEGTEALVYFEHWCNWVCGSGFYLVLRKGEEGWKVVKLDRTWIS